MKPTCVMTAELREAEMPEGDVVFTETPSEEWLSAFFPFEEITGPASQDVFRRMLKRLHVRTRFASVKRDGRTAACAATAMERGYALLQYVVVDPAHRGKGLGRTICRALLAEAAAGGAQHAYLQVMLNNLPALRLYESLGFRKAYDYCYVKQTGTGTDPVTDAYILR